MDSDPAVTFWRRTSTLLAISLAFAVVTICALIGVLIWTSMAHEAELKAARRQVETEREISVEMWKATDDALKRAHKEASKRAGK